MGEIRMMERPKQAGFEGGKPPFAQGSWFYGLVVGVAVSNLAASAMMAGTGAAIGKAIAGKPLPILGPRRG
jgi:hypothetical protein